MNILVIDKDEFSIQLLKMISRVKKDVNLIVVSDFSNGLKKYKNNNIDIVIVDYSYKKCKKLLKNILKINPNQNTITLSKDISCSEEMGCDFCIKNYNRRRLLKPFNPIDLMMIVNNFNSEKCRYFNSMEHIETIIDDIIKRYVDCKYDRKSKIITFSNVGNHSIQYLLDMVNILNQHNVKYKILGETDIQIL